MKLSLTLWFFFLAGTFLLNFLTPAQGVAPQEVRPEGPPLAPEESTEECTAPVVGDDFSWQPVIPTVNVPISFTATAWATTTAWVTETVDLLDNFWFVYPSLALDSAGYPHITYCDGSWYDKYLWYARYNGSVWEFMELGGIGLPDVCVSSTVLDAEDHPHIAYTAYFSSQSLGMIRYIWYDGTFWWQQTVDHAWGKRPYILSLAFDSSGRPHLAYSWYWFDTLMESSLNYAYFDGTAWITTTVDDRNAGMGLSLALDDQDRPHIAYYKQRPDPTVWYTYYSATSWISTSVPLGENVGMGVSLALDRFDRPHIVSSGWNAPVYAYSTGMEWITMTVDPDPRTGGINDLALDSFDRPHISYSLLDENDDPKNLRYAYFNGTSWITETVDRNDRSGCYSSLALDAEDRPHIAYTYLYFSPIYPVAYAHQATLPISPTLPLTYTWSFGDGSMGMGETVSHTYTLPGTYTVTLTATNCQSHTVVVSHTLEVHPCLPAQAAFSFFPPSPTAGVEITFTALPSGTPPIRYTWSFGDGTRAEGPIVHHTYPTGTYSLVLTATNCSPIPSTAALTLTVAPSCEPVREVEMAWTPPLPKVGEVVTFSASLPPPTWLTRIVDTAGNAGVGASLALDRFGRPHIAYLEGNTGRFRYARYNGRSWGVKEVEGLEQMEALSLALDGEGYPHLAYYSGYPAQDLRYAYYDGTSWLTETVDASGNAGRYLSLALDGAGHPHIAYYEVNAGDLRYARFDGTSWLTETVDAAGNAGRYASLGLDGAGHPHIAYYEANAGDLRYARYDGSAWHIETVDASGNAGLFASLSLDEAGYPHIAYYEMNAGDLRYARYDGSAWHIETVDAAGNAGLFASLSLDEAGYPHIAYYEASAGDLRYAFWDGSSWHIETAGASGDVGWYASLRLDGAGRPHVAYHGRSDGSLRYARIPPEAGRPLNYRWAFGDGEVGEGEVLTHTYALPGVYTVTLTATNCLTATAASSHTLTVLPPCEGAQLLTLSTVISGCLVSFHPEVSGTPPIAYLWEFGDGITSTEASPVHLYPASGVYSGTLRLRNCGGEAAYPFTVAVECPVGWRIYLPLVLRTFLHP